MLDFWAARVLARLLLASVAGTTFSEVRIRQRCESCGAPHGKPVVGNPHGYEVSWAPHGYEVSWAHQSGTVAAAAAQRAIGIDVISRRAITKPPLMLIDARTLSQTEALAKAGAGTINDLLLLDDRQRSDRVHVDRANRRLRLRGHSTPEFEVCVASSDITHQTNLESLVSGLRAHRS